MQVVHKCICHLIFCQFNKNIFYNNINTMILNTNNKIWLFVSQKLISLKSIKMQKHSLKPGTPCMMVPSKTIITSWLKSLFNDLPLNCKIQDFGDGVIYCRLINHYYGNLLQSKITWSPKNQYEYANNLKHVQTALLQLGVVIPFDVNRVAKRKFLENWALINSFYKHFNSQQGSHQDNSTSSHGVTNGLHNPLISQPNQYQTQTSQIMHHLQKPILKRPQPTTNPSTYEPQHNQLLNRASGRHMLQQPIWQHPTSNINNAHAFSTLAQNSLQMSQYLKQNVNMYNSSPSKGKWSVGSQMFQNNYHAVIDRVKQILLKGSHDTEKVRQIKMLLGMPLDEEEVIKIEDDDGHGPILYQHNNSTNVSVQEKDSTECSVKLQLRQIKEYNEVYNKDYSNSKEPKLSVSKSGRKPFKI